MPVLGHAFVGGGAALLARSATEERPALFLPAALVASYLPDIAGQAGATLGLGGAELVSHSLLVGAVLTPVVAAALSWIFGGFRRSLALTGFLLLSHDLLDALQTARRLPLYPLSEAPSPLPVILPSGLVAEAAIFAVVLGAMAAVRSGRAAAFPPTLRQRFGAGALITLAAVSSAAVTTAVLRERRERQADAAFDAVARRDYAQALTWLDAAERWPAPSKRGRIDYLRGEAYSGLGDRAAAERFYLSSLHADPTYVWALADLVRLYVSVDGPVEWDRVEPYLDRLRRYDEPYARRVVAKADARRNGVEGRRRER